MSLFDEVLEKTVRVVESGPFIPQLDSATIIRDLKGRVRLVLEFKKDAQGKYQLPSNWKNALKALKQQLSHDLQLYWGDQVWYTDERLDPTFRSLQDVIRTSRQPWDDPQTLWGSNLQWYKLERTFSKSSWLGRPAQLPWTLADQGNPAIVSFYSFKGGVGRTTAVAAVALILARAGRRVVVLDLDVEAPGVGTLLLGRITPPPDGIVDYLLERQLLNARPANLSLYTAVQNEQTLIGAGEPLRVLTAGRLDGKFLEKIARLDFEGFVAQGPNALADLLDHIREEYQPEYILLDVRSGLHDLGGLSLNGMSHLDVLFGLDTPQSWAGLEMIISILGAAEERHDLLLVHAMVTPDRIGEENQHFREHSFEVLHTYYYRNDEDMPDLEDDNAPYGLPIHHQTELLNVSSLEPVVERLTGSSSPYVQLARLIGVYLERDIT